MLNSWKLDRSVLRDPNWLHWAATIPLLAWSLTSGQSLPIGAAVVLCLAMGIYFFAQVKSIRSYPVQVRIAYGLILLAGLWPPLRALHVVQLFGTSAMVMVGYCPLMRTLYLAPWNDASRLTLSRVWRAIVAPSPPGGLFSYAAAQAVVVGAACSLRPVSAATDVVASCRPTT